MRLRLKKKLISLFTASTLVLQLLQPVAVLAQDASPEPSPEASIIPSPSPEITPEPSPSPTLEPTATPSAEPTANPTASPEPTNTETPSPATESTPQPTTDPSPSVSPSPTPTPELSEQLTATILENVPEILGESESVFTVSALEYISSATLITDKPDYAPTDIAIITGAGFLAAHTYTLIITSTDQPPVNFQTNITTDSEGNLLYSYQLDGTYRPNYAVEVRDGIEVIASTTFTDSPAPGCYTDSGGVNDEPGQKDLTKMCVGYTNFPPVIDVSWNWDEIGWTGNNSGDSCSLFDSDSDGFTNYSICVTVNGTPATYVSTTLYSCSDQKSDRCTNPSVVNITNGTTCTASVQAQDPFAAGTNYPNDTVATCAVNAMDVGGLGTVSLLDGCTYPSQQPNSDPSDCVLASTANQVGALEVVKQLVPTTDSGLFNLGIDANTYVINVGHNGTTGEKVVQTGNHTVFETAGTGTSLASYNTAIVCRGTNGTGSIVAQNTGSGSLVVNVAQNADIVCVITNTKPQGTITVNKIVSPSNDSGLFNLLVDGSTSTSSANIGNGGTTGAVVVNTTSQHTVSETAGTNTSLANYTTTYSCNNNLSGSGTTIPSFSITNGQNVVCTFTNTLNTGTITVNKVVSPANDPGLFNLQIDGSTAGTGVNVGDGGTTGSQTVLTSSQHTVSETAGTNTDLSNYTTTYSCNNNLSGSGTSVPSFSITNGQNVVCTFTNTRNTGTIIVTKDVVPNDNSQWDISVTGPSTASATLSDGGSTGNLTSNTGIYDISEAASSGTNGNDYTSTYSCTNAAGAPIASGSGTLVDDLLLDASDQITCAFTNTIKPGSIAGTKYHDKNANGQFDGDDEVLGNWTIFIDENANSALDSGEVSTMTDSSTGAYAFLNLNPATYTICEQEDTSWTPVSPVSRCQTVVVSAGLDVANINFFNFQNITISGYKFEDMNGDGDNEGNTDPLLAGWTINLSGSATDSAVTDGSGYYEFTNVGPGTYYLSETLQGNWVQTAGPITYTVNAVGGQNVANQNFGNFELATIYGYKYNDLNNDATTSGDLVLDGWTINLASNSGTLNTITGLIGGTGYYQFTGLLAGDYTLSEDMQPGWFQSYPGNGGTYLFTIQSGDILQYDFANWTTGDLTVCKYDENQSLVPGWEFTIEGGATQQTDQTGCTNFAGLNPGEYTVDETLEDGWIAISPASGSATTTIVSSGSATLNFYNERQAQLTIEKFNDENGNAVDDAEPRLEGWHFTVYQGTCDALGSEVLSGTTNSSGQLSGYLTQGNYCVVEDDSLLSAGWVNTTGLETDVALVPGEEETVYVGNQGQGDIIVTKYNDLNNNGQQDDGESVLGGWEFSLPPFDNQTTNDNGTTEFSDIPAGDYELSEIPQPGWIQTNMVCSSDSEENPQQSRQNLCHKTSSAAHPWNAISVPENNHNHDNHSEDFAYGGPVDANGHPDQSGEEWCAENVPSEEDDRVDEEVIVSEEVATTSAIITVDPGSQTSCLVGNHFADPDLFISKSNDATTDKNPGESVTFTLTIEATASAVNAVTVTDLPSNGFKYRPGSWTASSNVRGDLKTLGITTEPTYASPGDWELGDMEPGEVVTLTYIADISNDQEAGLYKDAAWSQGESLLSSQVIAQAVGGYVADTFVGTDVNVIGGVVASASYEVEKKEEGKVLGASTELPATGAHVYWIVIALVLLAGGSGLITWGIRQRKYEN